LNICIKGKNKTKIYKKSIGDKERNIKICVTKVTDRNIMGQKQYLVK